MKKSYVTVAAVVLVAGASGLVLHRRAEASQPAYRFATVQHGSVKSTVSATGTLSAVTTVQVGTQVSGLVSAIYTDFNAKVKKGQLLARIDPTLAQQAVADAEATLERTQAQAVQAQSDYTREKTLHDQKVVTDAEFSTYSSGNAVALSNVKSAQIALDKAKQNLDYTQIYAPIDGVIVERNVSVGQTVAASLSAPQLFLIANDLSQMQILANVDEGDIGAIKVGEPVQFTVQAYPNQNFPGTVQQVRLQSTTQDNVVNYTVVVSVGNPDGKLLPGMTATVNFLTGSATDVLVVPNAALRFRPSADQLAQAALPVSPRGGAAGGGSPAGRGGAAGVGAGQRSAGGTHTRPTNVATLWYLDKTGKLTAARVHTGLTDGQTTQVDGTGLTDGTQVIVGIATADQPPQAAAAGPFQAQGRRGGPGGF